MSESGTDRGQSLYLDIRDVIRAARLALSFSSLRTALVGSLLAYALWLFSCYAAFAADSSIGLSSAWVKYRFFPLSGTDYLGDGGIFLFVVGVVLAWTVLAVTVTAVAKTVLRELKGDFFFSRSDTMEFVTRHGGAAATAVMVLLAAIIVLLFLGLLAGQFGRLPWIGELSIGVMALPLIAAGIAVVFLLGVVIVALTVGPAIVASHEDDWLDVIIHALSVLWSQPWRWLLYECWLTVITAAVALFSSLLVFSGAWLSLMLLGWSIPYKLMGMTVVAVHYIPGGKEILWWIQSNLGPLEIRDELTVFMAGGLLSLALMVIFFLIVAYVVGTWSAGQMLIYLGLRYRKDGVNLLKRSDMFDRRLSRSKVQAQSGESEPSVVQPAVEKTGDGSGLPTDGLLTIEAPPDTPDQQS